MSFTNDDINNTKSVYSNISTSDIMINYTLWSEEGQQNWFVYKCRNKMDLQRFGKTFSYSSWIMMAPGLSTQEGLLNNNRVPFFSHKTIEAINRKITEIKKRIVQEQQVLDNNSIPLWYEYSSHIVNENVKEYNINIAIGNIAHKIKGLIETTSGNILSIYNVLKDIHLESEFHFYDSNEKKLFVKCSKDIDNKPVYLMMEFTQTRNQSRHAIKRVFGFSKNKVSIIGRYYLLKPQNRAAENLCNNLTNDGALHIINQIRNDFT